MHSNDFERYLEGVMGDAGLRKNTDEFFEKLRAISEPIAHNMSGWEETNPPSHQACMDIICGHLDPARVNVSLFIAYYLSKHGTDSIDGAFELSNIALAIFKMGFYQGCLWSEKV